MLAQDDGTKEDILMQNNKSYMLMHKNYPHSIERGTKHGNARFIFAVYKIAKKEVRIVYCLIEDIITNCSSKIIPGSTFEF